MRRSLFTLGLTLAACSIVGGITAIAQEIPSTQAAQAVPALVPYAGALPAYAQQRVSVRFSLYADPSSHSALWTEDQTLTPDKDGKYSILLGSASSIGLPPTLFADGQTRWLGIQVAGGEEQRSPLASVPFAMKAGDAETLAGHPATDLVTQDELRSALASQIPSPQQISPQTTTPTTPTGSGTTNYIPLWTSANTLGSSFLTQIGTGASTKLGIGTAAPQNTLDVLGGITARGDVAMEPSTLATASTAVNSPPFSFNASSWSSSLAKVVAQEFAFLTIVSGNNTANPTSSLQLWSVAGSTGLTATGLSISQKGIITFASGQTFPGATGGSNTVVNASSYDLGGTLFATGSTSQYNAFLGFSGNSAANTSSSSSTGIGSYALYSLTNGSSNSASGMEGLFNNTSGSFNTASGAQSLYENTTGSYNTALGEQALFYNATGSSITAIGASAGPDSSSTALSNATAIGNRSVVSQSNALILGQTTAGSPGASYVNVGIGTAKPASTMEISVNAPNVLGPTLLLSNPGGTTQSGKASAASIDFKTYAHASTQNAPTSRIEAVDDDYGNNLVFQTKIPGSDSNPLVTAMSLTGGTGGYAVIENALIVTFYNGVPVNGEYIAELGGNVSVDGTIASDQAETKIDHPSDPANKYLQHASVQSSELTNVYSGNVTTDELGLATVQLPDWFEAENADFRYQLTTIGRDAHAWVAEEVANHQFKIATNATRVKVSWQITGVRQDAYAKAHPLVVEPEKSPLERNTYLHPELYNQPESTRTLYATHPKQFQQTKAQQSTSASNAGEAQHK